VAVTKADTIARHVTQAATHIKTALELSHEPGGDVGGCVDAAARCINAAFLEALGGAAVAGEAVPEPPKPAGWVLPVDAAGNAIEAEDISATLRREECERKAARQAGEEREWEAMRDVSALADEHANDWHALLDHARTAADEVCGPQPVISAREAVTLIERKAFDLRTEAERLRTELAAVKAERDQLADAHRDVSAVAEEHAVAWHSLVDHIRTVADEVCGAQPVIAAAEALSLIESKAHTLRTALYRTEAERDRLRADLDAALTERADLRIALRAVEAERDKLTTDEADLRHALRQIAGMVGVAVALGASTEMHCAVADEVRLVVERLRHAADGMRKLADDMSTRCDAAETDVARLTKERDALAAEVQRGRKQKPVRDHSEVIAQCEEALRESSGLVIATDVMRPALRAALSALRGAS